ncbi:mannose-1-phosphate guanylyltransferase [Algoriphagus sp.]|uniref:mannose-1-phosphate guanylyltransferase n=1 Tax=Algoriphagus sp. TaxID=1872435 RepID=UPI003F6EDFC5
MENIHKIKHIILSGGVGSRLWPLSRKSKPKQYLEIFSGNSLFQHCIERNAFLDASLVVVGNEGNFQLSRDILDKMKIQDYQEIIEAVSKNTAPAIAFAALLADPEDILLVTPSDHLIDDGQNYIECVQRSILLAFEGKLVTFGIKPDRPESAYGYIEHSGEEVISFHEKPSTELAKTFLSRGNFLWNSGMFCFKAGVYLKELATYQPDIFHAASLAVKSMKEGRIDKAANILVPSQSVDYAVMEVSANRAVVPSNFQWSDMGSFDSLTDYFEGKNELVKDANGNYSIGSNKFISFVGVSNVILVETEDAILVLDKSSSQQVKGVYENLESANSILVN